MRKGNTIYLDHQASCPIDKRVLDGMIEAFGEEAGNPHSSEHSVGWRAARAVEEALGKIASLIGCDQDEITLTSGATEANNLAILGRKYSGRNKIVISPIEHKCVIECARQLQAQKGMVVQEVKVDSNGLIDLAHLADLVDEDTALVAIIGVHNEIGTIQPLERISDIARARGASVHLDMAQAPLAIDMSAVASLADTASLSGHKMYGPMGIGCLYVGRPSKPALEPILFGGGQQDGLRSGTVPTPLAVGMGLAAEIVATSSEDRTAIRALTQCLWEALSALPINICLNGPPINARHPGNLNVSIEGCDSGEMIGALQPNLAISSGSACTSGVEEHSYVLRAIGHSIERTQSALRLSVGRSTSEKDIFEAVSLIEEAAKRVRQVRQEVIG